MQRSVLAVLIVLIGGGVGWSKPSKKAVVGIVGIETAAQNIRCQGWDTYTTRGNVDCNRYLSEGFAQMLETAIFKAGKMEVLERQNENTLWREQQLGAIGLTAAGGQVGGLSGADYLIYGTITKFGARESGLNVSTNRGVGSMLGDKTRRALAGGLRRKKVTTEMGVDVKVTEVSTGRIVILDHVEAEIEQGQGFSIGGIEKEDKSADPFADVQRIVAARITEKIVTHHIPIKVIKVQANGTLIINYGEVFFKPGDMLAVFQRGESFVDPDTGEELGADETLLGMVEIIRVDKRFSRARVAGKSFDIAVGSTLKRLTQEKVSKGRKKRKRSGARIN